LEYFGGKVALMAILSACHDRRCAQFVKSAQGVVVFALEQVTQYE
jgi:hypothetical protein